MDSSVHGQMMFQVNYPRGYGLHILPVARSHLHPMLVSFTGLWAIG